MTQCNAPTQIHFLPSYTMPDYAYSLFPPCRSLPLSTFVFHSLLVPLLCMIAYFLCSAPYFSHCPTILASFSFSVSILTNLLSSSPSSLFPYISFFTSLLSSSFLTFFLNSYQISICCLPPGHHTSGSCSRLGLASSNTHLPFSTSI